MYKYYNNIDEDDDTIKQISLNDFDKISLLGCGGFGDVYLVKHKQTNMVYAMKSLNKEKIKKDVKKAQTEYKILLESHHPFISSMQYCFQTEMKLYIVMPYCPGGDLYSVMRRQPKKCLIESDVKYYASCILLALEYLHFNGIVYRDLKPENILMDKDGYVKLTDFDLSICSGEKVIHKCIIKRFSHSKGLCSEPNIMSNQQCGTAVYMAPEIVDSKIYGSVVDWWSFGILIFEMTFGVPPFQGKSIYDTFGLISKCKLKIPKITPYDSKLSHKLKNLIKELLQHEPEKRLGFNGGATDIKDHPYFKHIEFQLLKNQKPPIIPSLNGILDCHYFSVGNYINDPNIDTSKMVDPKQLKDGDIWKEFKTIMVG